MFVIITIATLTQSSVATPYTITSNLPMLRGTYDRFYLQVPLCHLERQIFLLLFC